MNRLFKIMPQHLNQIQVRTMVVPKSYFVFLKPLRGGLKPSCCRTQVHFSLRLQTDSWMMVFSEITCLSI